MDETTFRFRPSLRSICAPAQTHDYFEISPWEFTLKVFEKCPVSDKKKPKKGADTFVHFY